jgi:ABC-type lipoprotein release transport system permease subunit
MEVGWALDPLPLATGVLGGAALAVVAGLAASVRALQSRPVEALRA